MVLLSSNPIPESQIEKRRALERVLQKNVESLSVFEQSLEKTNQLTTNMNGILNSFDNRLSKLESFILPIHNSTSQLTRLHQHLNQAIDMISGYTVLCNDVTTHELNVSKGPGEVSIDVYIDSINHLRQALQSLESTRYKSAEKIIQDLRQSLAKGVQEMDVLFQQTLQDACTQVPEVSIDNFDNAKFPEELLVKLDKIATFLTESLVQIGPLTNFIKIYQETRSTFLMKTLSASVTAAKDQEIKMGYSRQAYQRGTTMLIPYCKKMLLYLELEHELSSMIIPKHHAVTCFVTTIATTIDTFIETADAVVNRVRRNAMKRDINEINMLIDIWEGLDAAIEQNEQLLAHCAKKGYEIKSCVNGFLSTVLSYLRDFYDEFHSEDSKQKQQTLSSDGTVHETTSTTMNSLKKLFDAEDAIEIMISKNSTTVPFPYSSLSDYTLKIVQALLEDIESKSNQYKQKPLAYLFGLNNLHHVLKSTKGTKIGESVGEKMTQDIERTIKKHTDSYRSTWLPLCEHLMDNTKISDSGKIVTTLSRQQRDDVKDKFKNFNKEFDDICQAQMRYAIPDVELRAQVIKEIKSVIVPMYNRFYDRYTEMDFSKNPEKYIKYTKETLVQTLDKFFDASK
ncbi:Cullin repeat-like-containing domain protein [Gorgonomyces haynaldii]|nr:Cullin repeat-like-containing domain protein [Gorgonomyces haynaldii]